MFPSPPSTNIQQIIERSDWRQTLANDYQGTANRLLTAYARSLPDLRTMAEGFVRRLEQDTENPLSTKAAGGTQEYRDLLKAVQIEMTDFSRLLRTEVGRLADGAVIAGADGALEMATSTAGHLQTLVQSSWNRVAPESLRTLIGYVDSDAFRQKIDTFGEKATQNVADLILTGVAQGKGPRVIAGMLRNWLAVPYVWADNTVRTAQLYSYREANHLSFEANPDVLNGWVWIASLGDTRTCMSCIAQHGSIHPLSDRLNDHHRGRCVPAPWVKGTTWPQTIINGPTWFESLTDDVQKLYMGGALYNAWKAGAIGWDGMSQHYHDDVYGDMLRRVSVNGALGEDEAKQYYVRNQRSA